VESTIENGVEGELWIIVDTEKLTTVLFVDPQILTKLYGFPPSRE